MTKKQHKNPRLRLIRLVMQLSDTKHNRKVMDRVQLAAQNSAVQSPYASIKRENVTIAQLLTTGERNPQKEES